MHLHVMFLLFPENLSPYHNFSVVKKLFINVTFQILNLITVKITNISPHGVMFILGLVLMLAFYAL